MRGGNRLLVVLTLGGAVSAAGAVVIDMPPSPVAARNGADPTEPSGADPSPKLGDVALKRYARARYEPSYTDLASWAWRGWPYGRFWYGYGYSLAPSWGWGWFGWGSPYYGFRPYRCGYGLRSAHGSGHRFRFPNHRSRGRRARFTFRRRRRA